MTRILDGIIHVAGEHDTGKTTFALESGASPERICMFDDDVKGRATVEQLRRDNITFGAYHDLIAIAKGKTELKYHEAVLSIISSIKPEQFDVIIWDTWTHFASSCHPYVVKYPDKFRDSWSPMGKFKGPQQWKEARRYEAGLLSYMSTLAKQVVVITHLTDTYINEVKVPDKLRPDSSKVLESVPRMRIWLRQNSSSPVPVGLILKRLDKKVVQDGKVRTISVLPRKIAPLPTEHSLWDTIWRYWDNPIDLAEPDSLEIPTEYELGILDGTLTKDQKYLMQQMIEHGLVRHDEDEVEDEVTSNKSPEALARSLAADGLTAAQIAEQLGKPLVLVNKWVAQ